MRRGLRLKTVIVKTRQPLRKPKYQKNVFCHPALGSATPPWVVHRVVPRVPSPPKNKHRKMKKTQMLDGCGTWHRYR